MRMKTVFTAAFLAGCIALLCGCEGSPSSSAPSSSSGSDAGTVVAPAAVQTNGIEALRDDLESDGFASSSGFYRIISREDTVAFNLCYTDFATGQEIYLCNQPNCTHNNDSCPSWFGLDFALTYPVPVGDKLVLIHGAVPSYAEVMGENGVAQVILTNLDGSERKTIARFESTDRVATMPLGGLARDNENVYFVLQSDIDGARTLYAANIKTETVEEVYVMPEPGEKIVGGAGDELILSYCPELFDIEAENEDMINYLVRFDPKTKNVTPLFSHPYLEACACDDGKYFRLSSSGTIYTYDLESGQIISEKQADLQPASEGDYFESEGFFDGKMLVSIKRHIWQGKIAEQTFSPEYWTVDPATGETKKLDFFYSPSYAQYSENDYNNQPYRIVAETQDSFLIVTGDTLWDVMLPQIDEETGELRVSDALISDYSLISKTDFWANKDTSVPIKTAVVADDE